MTGYPKPWELGQFFGAYFHQDWVFEAADWRQVVDDFSASPRLTADRLNELADSISGLLVRHSESELPSLLRDLDCYYDPRPETTFSDWLRLVAHRLRENAAAFGGKH
jgi:ParB-like chromosome segregation protein Spo0J